MAIIVADLTLEAFTYIRS
jgi:hypothetical protein